MGIKADIRHAKGYHKAGSDQSFFAEALEVVKTADLVILTLGGKCGSGSIATMGEGVDTTDINLPECRSALPIMPGRFRCIIIIRTDPAGTRGRASALPIMSIHRIHHVIILDMDFLIPILHIVTFCQEKKRQWNFNLIREFWHF